MNSFHHEIQVVHLTFSGVFFVDHLPLPTQRFHNITGQAMRFVNFAKGGSKSEIVSINDFTHLVAGFLVQRKTNADYIPLYYK